MGKKRGRLTTAKKARGRPQKLKKKKMEEEDEEFETNSSVGDGDGDADGDGDGDGDASLPGPASESLDTRTVSSCQTRYAKALADKKAESNTPSRTTFQNDGNPSETSTLLLVKKILFDANRSDAANYLPVEVFPSNSSVQAQDLHSQRENISPDKSIEARDGTTVSPKTENQKHVLDLKKFTSDLLAQTQKPELPTEAASSCSDEIMIDNNLPEREANVVSNRLEVIAKRNVQTVVHSTRLLIHNIPMVAIMDDKSSENNELISEPGNPSVDVGGYKVKQELVPLLTAIFRKYGDIAKESTFSMESRACLLELVCSIYRRLEATKFMELKSLELESMLHQIGDLKLVKVEVGWLHRRLNQILKARQLYDGVSTLEDVEARSALVVEETQKAVETHEKELEAGMAAVKKLKETLHQEKDELAATLSVVNEIKNFYDGSLVHGLI